MPELKLQQCYLLYIIITNYKSTDLSIKKKENKLCENKHLSLLLIISKTDSSQTATLQRQNLQNVLSEVQMFRETRNMH